MPKITDTAYPRLKPHPSLKELERLFTPTPEERQFAWARTNTEANTVRLLVWLKVFQRLGYFPSSKEISIRVIGHVADSLGALSRIYNCLAILCQFHNQPRASLILLFITQWLEPARKHMKFKNVLLSNRQLAFRIGFDLSCLGTRNAVKYENAK